MDSCNEVEDLAETSCIVTENGICDLHKDFLVEGILLVAGLWTFSSTPFTAVPEVAQSFNNLSQNLSSQCNLSGIDGNIVTER